MKIIIGGSVGYKMMAKAYEPIDANTTFSIEIEDDKFLSDEKIEEYQEKVNKILQKQLSEKLTIVAKSYKEAKVRLTKILNS